MRSVVLVFPGSNCDRDVAVALAAATGRRPSMVWHRDTDLPPTDLIVVPGGFSYGDYLRSGSVAALSPVMAEVKRRAGQGVPVLGICNGFQILTEAGLLPGVLMRNRDLRFLCRDVFLRVERTATAFTNQYQPGQVLRLPIAHHDGNFFADPDTLARLADNEQIVLRYCAPDGALRDNANPNGSMRSIAGICNETGNILGLMPHPERASEALLGNTDGAPLFQSLVSRLAA